MSKIIPNVKEPIIEDIVTVLKKDDPMEGVQGVVWHTGVDDGFTETGFGYFFIYVMFNKKITGDREDLSVSFKGDDHYSGLRATGKSEHKFFKYLSNELRIDFHGYTEENKRKTSLQVA